MFDCSGLLVTLRYAYVSAIMDERHWRFWLSLSAKFDQRWTGQLSTCNSLQGRTKALVLLRGHKTKSDGNCRLFPCRPRYFLCWTYSNGVELLPYSCAGVILDTPRSKDRNIVQDRMSFDFSMEGGPWLTGSRRASRKSCWNTHSYQNSERN